MSYPICASHGPRIGSEGAPRCKRPLGHPGQHMPDPEDGWSDGMSWGSPAMPDFELRAEYAAAGREPYYAADRLLGAWVNA